MGSCPRSPAAPAQAVGPSSLSRNPTRSQWICLFGRHTPYERFGSGHRHGVRDRFGTTVVDNTGWYSIALTTTLASGPASWTVDEPPELSVSRPTSTTRTTTGR
jgi:hypothetical protein